MTQGPPAQEFSGREQAVAATGLKLGYGGKVVVEIAEMHVSRGERVFLHGPSGCGKTTLLGAVAGVLPVLGGSLKVLGCELAGASGSVRDALRGEHIGYVFQMFNLIPYLSVAQNIVLPCRLNAKRRKRLPAAGEGEALRGLAADLGLETLLDKPATELSVGQQQRVAVARALIGSPELVIADEPTSALDVAHRDRFLDLLFRECDKAHAALLFVSHDPGLAQHFSRKESLPALNRAAGAPV